MDLRHRLGRFLTFAGVISLFVFFASLYTPDKHFNYGAFVVGVLLISVGWPMRRAKKVAPPPAAAKPAAPPAPKPAAKPAGPAPKKPGLLSTILKGPPPKKPAAPPPPPPPPPKKKGLAALFSPKPKKK